jgi:hypothetical protein
LPKYQCRRKRGRRELSSLVEIPAELRGAKNRFFLRRSLASRTSLRPAYAAPSAPSKANADAPSEPNFGPRPLGQTVAKRTQSPLCLSRSRRSKPTRSLGAERSQIPSRGRPGGSCADQSQTGGRRRNEPNRRATLPVAPNEPTVQALPNGTNPIRRPQGRAPNEATAMLSLEAMRVTAAGSYTKAFPSNQKAPPALGQAGGARNESRGLHPARLSRGRPVRGDRRPA